MDRPRPPSPACWSIWWTPRRFRYASRRVAPDDWTVAAAGSWVVALDNLSKIEEWLSDCLCRASTGEGRVVRALYTDGDLSTICFRRCVILNSIDVGAVRPDLADRLVLVDVKRIKAEDRRGETDLDEQWGKVLPEVFRGLLDLAAAVHKRLPEVSLPSSPRMADFAKVLAAVDAELNTTGLDRYRQRGKDLVEDGLSANSFIESLRTTDRLAGADPMTAAQLLELLTAGLNGERPRDWPGTSREVTSILRRYAPSLRRRAGRWRTTVVAARETRCGGPWFLRPPRGRVTARMARMDDWLPSPEKTL